jgi:hypothetical protein
MRPIYTLILLMTAAIHSIGLQAQQSVVINNKDPRKDDRGRIVDAHDGRIIRFGNLYYLYGTAYGTTNGFTTANEYVCYSSSDLRQWKFEGPLLKTRPEGVYYRPHVVYNVRTKKYILWYNWYPKLWNGQFGVAESVSPTGPFTVINENVSVKHSALGVGDLGVFVDGDNKAYLSYNTIKGHKVSVELLDDNYTASTLKNSDFIAENCEAGAMFKRGDLYYLLTDYTCCFCTQGSGARVFTSKFPLGPFTFRQNINTYPGPATPLLMDGVIGNNFYESFSAGEKNGIEVWMKESVVNVITLHQFTGDRNGQCGDVNNPKVHDTIPLLQFRLQYFDGGNWKNLPVTTTSVKSSSLHNSYRISFSAIKTERLRIMPLYADSNSVMHLSEIEIRNSVRPVIFKTGIGTGKPIIPAQQAYIMEVTGKASKYFVWVGDLWGSAMDNIKGHDFQFWSAPLHFYSNGLIAPLQWHDKWQLSLK